jgi:hypothetical protein
VTEQFSAAIPRCSKDLHVRNEAGELTETLACSQPPHGPMSRHRYEAKPFDDLPIPSTFAQPPSLVYLGTDGTVMTLDRYDWAEGVAGVRGSRESAIIQALLSHAIHGIATGR